MTGAKGEPLKIADRQAAVGLAFDTVARARHALRAVTDVSTATAIDYSKKTKLVLDEFAAAKGRGEKASLNRILARYAPRPPSFRAMRAALVWHFKQRAKRLLKEQDDLQRIKPRPDSWLSTIGKLDQMLKMIEVLERLECDELLALTGELPRAKQSKKKDLAKMPRDWKKQIVDRGMSSPLYKMPLALTAAMGCRPAELLKGITLRIDGESIVGRCLGAKVTASSGQPWREMTFAEGALPVETRAEIERAGGELLVRISKTANFKAHLTRLSKSLWPDKPAVTAYVFRHFFTETLREAGWDSAEIGGALGHVVANTQAHYGRKTRSGTRNLPASPTVLKGIKTALPVRPLDLSSLAATTSGRTKNRLKVR